MSVAIAMPCLASSSLLSNILASELRPRLPASRRARRSVARYPRWRTFATAIIAGRRRLRLLAQQLFEFFELDFQILKALVPLGVPFFPRIDLAALASLIQYHAFAPLFPLLLAGILRIPSQRIDFFLPVNGLLIVALFRVRGSERA